MSSRALLPLPVARPTSFRCLHFCAACSHGPHAAPRIALQLYLIRKHASFVPFVPLAMSNVQAIAYSDGWEDPLPHVTSPVKTYLSKPSGGGSAKAGIIFMHGRGDNANDFVECFLPTLQRRYGDHDDSETLAVIAIEARDNVWYPNSHNATDKPLTEESEPYQYSALIKIRDAILELHEQYSLALDNIIFVGFSQGAILLNTYLLAGIKQLLGETDCKSYIPLPGYALALAGSLFKTPPRFPSRGYASEEHEQSVTTQPDDSARSQPQPQRVISRLLFGLADQYFPEDEIHAAAAELSQYANRLDSPKVTVSVGVEEGQGHVVTPRMVAAVVQSVDAILDKS